MIWFLGILAGIAVGAALLAEEIKGSKFSVLGERRTGKTKLFEFLTTGTLSKEYIQTLYPKKTIENDLKLRDLELKIEESVDVPGSTDDRGDWKDITQKADVILYLIRVDKLMEGDKSTERRVESDMGQIDRWLKDTDQRVPLFIVGTHCDLTKPDLTKLPKDKKGDYRDRVRQMPILKKIRQLSGGGNRVKFAFGSLKSTDTAEELVFDIIYQYIQHIDREKGTS